MSLRDRRPELLPKCVYADTQGGSLNISHGREIAAWAI